MQKYFFFAVIISLALLGSLSSAHAESFFAAKIAKNYDNVFLGYDSKGNEIHKWTSHPDRILDQNGNYVDYRLFQNSTIITLETANSGSLVFNKASCSYSMYNNGQVGGTNDPIIKGISYTVKGKANNTQTWSNVNSVNNAACSATVQEDGTNVKITGEKANGAGTFQIILDYHPGLGIKETLRAYNNNPAWTNNNIGFTEKFQVPQTIKLGQVSYDLSQYNNTVLDRTWIKNNAVDLIRLTDKINYDFGYGWKNLQDIKITWINGQAFLSLNYLYGGYVIPYQQWIEVDPTFGPSTGTNYLSEANAGASAGCTATTFVKTQTNGRAEIQSAGDAGNPTCHRAATSFNVTSIPDAITSVTLVNLTTTTSVPVGMGAESCEYHRVMNPPASASAAVLWNDITAGTTYVTGNTSCRTANTFTLTLGSTANSEIKSSINAGNNTWHVGIKLTSEARSGTASSITFGTTQLTVIYANPKPNAVTTLHTTTITTTSIGLAWTAPNLNSGTCSGYQINYTTPWGVPTTILVNNTGSCATSYTVSSLVAATDYSFRVTVRTDGGTNVTGANYVNATTLTFNQANYTIGSFSYNANNPTLFPIRYERVPINSSDTLVNVTFNKDYSLACDLRYTYAGTNHTYKTISSSLISATEREASFRFKNATNEITTFHCWNQNGNQSANYVLTQSNFLLIQQIHDFRSGVYGTSGQLGAFDFITLIVVIIAMIGFNRTNEAVGGFFCIIAIAIITFFGIITWQFAIISAMAVVVMLVISSTRKD